MDINKLFTTIDTHTAGEPLRIITGGLPFIKGDTMLQKRAYFQKHFDDIRRLLMHEPRGHHGMYGCIMTPPVSNKADFGVLFMHNEGFSTMCGHGIIAVVTAAIETGLLHKKNDQQIVIDTPAGQVVAHAVVEGSTVKTVSFENVPSFVMATDVSVQLPNANVKVDIAYGGAFYAVVKAVDLGVSLEVEQLAVLQKLGTAIKEGIERQMEVRHPLEKEVKGIYGVLFTNQSPLNNCHYKNVTIFANQQIDRSPCGTGTSAKMAALYHRGELQVGDVSVHEGIVHSQLEGSILSTTTVGQYQAIVPQIKGRASITGLHQFVVDPTDPLKDGFLVG